MRIIVLGAGGTIGGFLFNSLKDRYDVTGVFREDLDLTNADAVNNFFDTHSYDVVINGAINADSSFSASVKVAQDNLTMFTNLYANRHKFGRVIQFGSGAEFDRSLPIDRAKEEEIFNKMPADAYGISKNTTSRIAAVTDNWYTIRLFGAFYRAEKQSRLLPSILSNSPITIVDKYFDYIYLEDLLPVVESYINHDPVYKNMNLVYSEKMLLSDFVKTFCSVHQLPTNNITYSGYSDLSYTGNGDKWQSLNLPTMGITKGLMKYIHGDVNE